MHILYGRLCARYGGVYKNDKAVRLQEVFKSQKQMEGSLCDANTKSKGRSCFLVNDDANGATGALLYDFCEVQTTCPVVYLAQQLADGESLVSTSYYYYYYVALLRPTFLLCKIRCLD